MTTLEAKREEAVEHALDKIPGRWTPVMTGILRDLFDAGVRAQKEEQENQEAFKFPCPKCHCLIPLEKMRDHLESDHLMGESGHS